MLPCPPVKLATWNVNSIRARLDRVTAWLQARSPDIVCLQELKVEADKFRTDEFVYKMAWLERLRAYLAPRVRPDLPLVLCGDFNIAPTPEDVYDPIAWEGQCLFSLEERAALSR